MAAHAVARRRHLSGSVAAAKPAADVRASFRRRRAGIACYKPPAMSTVSRYVLRQVLIVTCWSR
jgi:hypothetical protein